MQSSIEKILSDKLDITQTEADRVFNAVIGAISEALVADPELRIRNLGTLKVVARPARTYRNPQTGEAVEKPATQVVKFEPSKKLKEAALKAVL